MTHRLSSRLAATLIAAASLCASAHASGLDALEAFVRSAKSGHADFTQVVTGPTHEGQAARTKTSSGTFEFARPDRFRFDYRKPFEQVIVADGQTLWLYDADLNQVTARRQSQVLASTPAAVIASAPDLAALRRDFDLEPAADRDGLQWVRATPKVRDGQLREMRVGFRGNSLAALEIDDSFGQKSVVTFTNMALNAPVAASNFQFKPPQGATVLKQ